MMKIRHLLYLLPLTWTAFATSTQHIEKGAPLQGRVKVHARMDKVLKKIQITGSLTPLRVFINGQERTRELVSSECSEASVKFNEESIPTQGGPGVFYWEGIQSKEKNALRLKKNKTCKELSFTLPFAFFEKGYNEEIYLNEKDAPKEWKVNLEAETVKETSIKVDQGLLTEKGFEHTLLPGENIVTGILRDKTGKETPLHLKFYFNILYPENDKTGIQATFVKTIDNEITIKGKTNPGNNLFLNDQKQDIESDGTFEFSHSLGVGKNNLKLKSVSGTDEVEIQETFSREVELDKAWPILPEGSYLGLAPIVVYAHESTISDFRVNPGFMGKIFYGTKKWEFFFRHFDKEDQLPTDKNDPSPTILKQNLSFGVMKLYPYRKAFHFGAGLSYNTQKILINEKIGHRQDLNFIIRAGWMYTLSNKWSYMAIFSPFFAIPLGEAWETYGFEFVPASLVYAF